VRKAIETGAEVKDVQASYTIIRKEIFMEFVKVIDKTELTANKMVMVVVGSKEVLLANVDGSYYAIANKCTHLGGSLAKGVLDGSIVTCPKHGARFDVTTGEAVGEAKIAFMKMQVKDEESYVVKVEGTDILVGIP
jgi:3-phenylpropionate/trans-cinnamate dioxygenase ferredoxin subunit